MPHPLPYMRSFLRIPATPTNKEGRVEKRMNIFEQCNII
jgi:hypothetical protein